MFFIFVLGVGFSFNGFATEIQSVGLEVLGGKQNPYWYLKQIEMDRVGFVGNPTISVGLISTGANYHLDFLKPNIAINPFETVNGQDDDGNGYIDDVYGVNTRENTGDPMDYHGIGTHVAGVIGHTNLGIVKQTSLLLANPLNDQGAGSTADLYKALKYLIDRGARIIDIGVGGGSRTELVCELIAKAKEQNILFIATAGNSGGNFDEEKLYPSGCGSDNILVVASSNENDALTGFSSYGPNSVHLAAPGINIGGFNHLGEHAVLSGGSFSSAIVTGVAALVLSVNPNFTYDQVKKILMYSVDISPDLKDKVISGGRVNAYKAVRLARSMPH
ncbi:MAG: hypothetical protein A3B70_01565 [Deltaproteobacteria bacterium RIFCSPHIGHO2_02_FULL_40_11]|nr:MAG: hypothetical protein A3B70_01565 [Deltaproteobacteria bacterium RIFCSPHIGHO2_02_FULL_40_11]